jgi:programmed cell death protein 4
MVANFLARAVVDEVLPPAYLSEQNNSRPGDAVIEKAVSLLSREHCTARLERVWGPGDGRPVAELKVEMDQILSEYLLSRELDEAARCVKELDAAHYMHELVKRGVKIAMEQDGKDSETQHAKSAIDAMAALLTFLVKNAIISEHQGELINTLLLARMCTVYMPKQLYCILNAHNRFTSWQGSGSPSPHLGRLETGCSSCSYLAARF